MHIYVCVIAHIAADIFFFIIDQVKSRIGVCMHACMHVCVCVFVCMYVCV